MNVSTIFRTGKFRILALVLASALFFSACTQGIKFHPSDRTDPAPEVVEKQDDVKQEAKAAKEEATTKPEADEADAATADADSADEEAPDEAAKTAEDKSDKADQDKADKSEQATTAPTEPEPQAPTVQEVKDGLKKEDFSFYVNNLVNDPEPKSVVYGDKAVGKAELTVFYAYFDDQEAADKAIANLLESDMIGKAMSFGAELEKLVDESGNKVYTVTLNSWLATARAEMRQDGERIGLVLLYKKNNDVVFEPYFELMGLDDK